MSTTFFLQGYGRAQHSVSTEKIKAKYPDYEVTWADDGYRGPLEARSIQQPTQNSTLKTPPEGPDCTRWHFATLARPRCLGFLLRRIKSIVSSTAPWVLCVSASVFSAHISVLAGSVGGWPRAGGCPSPGSTPGAQGVAVHTQPFGV